MPRYRRAIVPGGTFLFTVVTDRGRKIFQSEDARNLLGECLRECQSRWDFEMDALVLLYDHLHAIWTLPREDSNYSQRWGWIKKEFSKRWVEQGGNETEISEARKSEKRKGVWQPRFWEHAIEDEEDFSKHFDYIHYNPVKHGYVRCPKDWVSSSFHRWVRKGV